MRQLKPLNQRIKNKVESKGLLNILKKSSGVNIIGIVIILVIAAAFFVASGLLYWEYSTSPYAHPDDLLFVAVPALIGVVMLLSIIIGFVISSMRKRSDRNWLESLEKLPGGAEGTIKEIETQLTQGETYMTPGLSGDYITPNWYIRNNRRIFSAFIPITDIALVIRGSKRMASNATAAGISVPTTFVHLANGNRFETDFGKNTWSHAIWLLKTTNPHLLTNGDQVNTNGRVIDVSRARSSDIQFLIEEFKRRRNADE